MCSLIYWCWLRDPLKTTLLFVVRDYLAVTPQESLRDTIVSDIERLWQEICKPEPFLSKSLSDFFDLEFTFLPHKILKPSQFEEATDILAKKFQTSEDIGLFKEYMSGKIVPADGLCTYMRAIWDRISTNKDLNLPTQQQLLAQYRCDELAQEIFSNLIEPSKDSFDLKVNVKEFTNRISSIKSLALGII